MAAPRSQPQQTGSFYGSAPSGGNPFASASLYVGDLLPDVTEANLFELFNGVGPVASIRVCRDSQTRRSLGYAYVNFHSVSDAERALDTMNFTAIRGQPCRIMWSQRDPALRKSGKGNIFVKNLHASIDNNILYDTFSVFGNILSCKVMRDEKGKSLEYGYVHYVDEESATKAISGVNGMYISKKQVEASFFKPRNERESERKFTNVYVKHIPIDWDVEKLKTLFEETTGGKIDSPYWKQNDFGIFACLNFEDHAHALSAVNNLHDFDTGNEANPKLYVARAESRKTRQRHLQNRNRGPRSFNKRGYWTGVNLYVKNLGPEVQDDGLKSLFAKFGKITSARVMLDKTTRNSRGFGFVCFENKEDAVRAMTEMNTKIIEGKPLYVARAQRKATRQAWLRRQRDRMNMNNNPGVGGGFPPYYGGGGMGGGVRPMPNQFMPFPGARGPFGGQVRQMYPGIPPMQPQMQSRYITPQQQQMIQQQNYINQMQMMPPRSQPGQSYPSVVKPTTYSANNSAAVSAGAVHPQASGAPVPHPNSTPQHLQGGSTQQSVPIQHHQPLTAQLLSNATPAEQKRMIGERLFPRIQQVEPRLAGKITGMLLEMDNIELLMLIESQEALTDKINEALKVLREHQQAQSQSNPNPGME